MDCLLAYLASSKSREASLTSWSEEDEIDANIDKMALSLREGR